MSSCSVSRRSLQPKFINFKKVSHGAKLKYNDFDEGTFFSPKSRVVFMPSKKVRGGGSVLSPKAILGVDKLEFGKRPQSTMGPKCAFKPLKFVTDAAPQLEKKIAAKVDLSKYATAGQNPKATSPALKMRVSDSIFSLGSPDANKRIRVPNQSSVKHISYVKFYPDDVSQDMNHKAEGKIPLSELPQHRKSFSSSRWIPHEKKGLQLVATLGTENGANSPKAKQSEYTFGKKISDAYSPSSRHVSMSGKYLNLKNKIVGMGLSKNQLGIVEQCIQESLLGDLQESSREKAVGSSPSRCLKPAERRPSGAGLAPKDIAANKKHKTAIECHQTMHNNQKP